MRSSHFSLSFPAIRPTVPGKIRGKVDPHCKSYAWVSEVWSFNKLREVAVFSYLVTSCLKSHENGFGSFEVGKGHGYQFQRNGTDA